LSVDDVADFEGDGAGCGRRVVVRVLDGGLDPEAIENAGMKLYVF